MTSDKHGIKQNIAQTAVLMMILTLISKLLGFVRELVLANFYGASYIVDAYVLAQSIPGMIFGGVFAAIGTAYLPTFSKITETKGENEGNQFTSRLITLGTIAACVAFIFGFLLSDWLVSIIAPKFNEETAYLSAFYLKIIFSYMIFNCASQILTSYMQYNNSYLHPIIGGYFQNIAVIAFIIISAYSSYYYIAFGLFFGYLLMMVYIYAFARMKGYKYSFDIKFGKQIKDVLLLSLPVFVGTSISNINSFVDKTLASSLQEGSIASLNYGYLLITLIVGLTTSIISTIIYPKITKAKNLNDWSFYNTAVDKGIYLIVIIGLPSSLGLIAFSDQIVQVVYERGAFDEAATSLTGSALLFYGFGLLFIGISTFLTYVFYSMSDMKAPVICSAISVGVNIAVSISLVGVLAHRGLALGTSIASIVNTACQYILLKKKYGDIKILSSKMKLLKVCIASVISVGLAVLSYRGLVAVIWMPRMVYLGLAVLAAVVVYFVLLVHFKIDEVDLLKSLVKH